MKIAVFGSTGPSGQLIIKYALAKGYEVVAYARNPAKISFQDKKLIIVKGNLNDVPAIEKAINGVDAVISILGPSSNVKTTELSNGTMHIINAMKKYNVGRLVAMGTASVNDENDLPVFKFRLLVSVVKKIIPGAYREIRLIGSMVKQSGLDWTLIRLGLLTNKTATGKLIAGYYGQDKINIGISRADLAKFFVDQVEDTKYIQKAPAISN